MSTVKTFMGMDTEAKSSSRVLQAPGGASSGIFGGYPEDKPRQQRKENNNDVLSQKPATPQKAAPTQKIAYNPITGEPIEVKKTAAEEKQENEEKDSNTTNGVAEEKTEAKTTVKAPTAEPVRGEEVIERRSTRVAQPPGGISTPLW